VATPKGKFAEGGHLFGMSLLFALVLVLGVGRGNTRQTILKTLARRGRQA